jgi:tetratricopeptide (TPR) repeat protein/DNA-binding winged helix-turn-helix (wHTH) protein
MRASHEPAMSTQIQARTSAAVLPGDILVTRSPAGVRMQPSLLKGFYLQDLLIEPTIGRVSGPGVEAHLKPKAVEVLLYLAGRPFELVERDELLKAVWGDNAGSSDALTHVISDLRSCCHDHANSPSLIQTVPRRGYRLLQQPRPIDEPEPDSETIVFQAPDDGSFIGKLMRRGVVQAGFAYMVFGWALIQVADLVTPILNLPEWLPSVITYAAVGGFPIVLVLAWMLERSEGRWLLDRGRQSGKMLSGLERNYLSILLAYGIAAVGALAYQMTVGFDLPGDPDALMAEEDVLLPVHPNSIAVLRFMNIDGSEQSEVFSHGLAEDVLDRLARIPGLLVSARGDSWSLPVNSRSTDVRQRLRVAYYLEGSVRIVGDELRVVAQLIDSERGVHIVSRSFDKKLENFLEVQREITELTVANLRVVLPEETQMLFANEYQGLEVDAYIMYRRGKDLMNEPMTEDVQREATSYFKQALTLDPGYAAAHAGLCSAYTMRYTLTSNPQFIEDAERACAAGMAANSNLHMIYTATGDLYSQTGNLPDAESAYLSAININGQDVLAMEGLAAVYERQQRFEEAQQLMSDAIQLQPGNWRTLNSLGRLYFRNGMYREAADAYARVVALDPGNSTGHGNLGSSLMMIGDFEGAAKALQASLEIEPDRTYLSNLAIIYYYLGRYDESVSIYRQAVEESPNQSYVWLNYGDALFFSNEPEKAEAAFRRCAEIAEKLLDVNPGRAEVMYELAWSKAMLGDVGSARQLINRSMSIDPDDPYVHYYDALVSVKEGQYDHAIAALQQSVAGGNPAIMLANEPHLNALRDMPGFIQLISPSD